MEKKDHFRDPKVLKELIQNLVGPIMPTGCDSEDRNRLENLKIYGELIDSMVIDLDNIVFYYRDHHEESIKNLVKQANIILDGILGIEGE